MVDGAGVGHAAALHDSPSGIANAPNTALQLTSFTTGDFVGYFVVRPAVTVCTVFFSLPPAAESWPLGRCEQKGCWV